jgi:hypothetical protein
MRKPKEIQLAILSLKKDKESAPMYSFFGVNNHAAIDLGLDILEGRIDEDELYTMEDNGDITDEERSDAMSYIEYMDGHIELVDLLINSESLVTATDTNSTVCKSTCSECPFSNKSQRGWLSDYTLDDFKNYMAAEVSFPCHMQMSKDDKTVEEAAEAVNRGEMTLCRGYVECVIKSAKMPYKNDALMKAVEMVNDEGLSEHTMSIFEFIEHHTPFKK